MNWFHLYMSGFRDEPLSIDPYFESGWYDSQWKWVFDNRNDIDLLLAWTWNEYHEQNFIEPTVTDLPVGVAEVCRDKTRFYLERLSSGKTYQRHQGPAASVNDLRQMVGSIGYSEPGLTSEMELETFLSKIIFRAESHVAGYSGGESGATAIIAMDNWMIHHSMRDTGIGARTDYRKTLNATGIVFRGEVNGKID